MPQVPARAVGPLAEVGEGEVGGVLRLAAPHLGGDGDVEAGVVREVVPDEALAAAVAVDVCGVEEGHAGLDGGVEHGAGVIRAHVAPVRAQLPGAEADHGYGAAGAAQGSSVHAPSLNALGRVGLAGSR